MVNWTDYNLSLYAVPYLVAAFLSFLIGFAVLVRENASRISLRFFVLILSTVAWLIGYGGLALCANSETALYWSRLHASVIVFIPLPLLAFTLSSVKSPQRLWKSPLAAAAVSSLFTAAIWKSDFFVLEPYLYPWGYYPHYGNLSYLFLVYFFSVLLICLFIFWRKMHSAGSPTTHKRMRLFLLAFGIAYFASLDYLPMYGVALYPGGYLPFFTGLLLLAYGIIRYRLEDITPSSAGRQIINTMADALLIIDREIRVRIANDAAARLFSDGKPLAGRDAARLGIPFFNRANIKRLIEGASIQQHEITFSNTAGQAVSAEMSTSVLRDRDGAGLALICIAKDISERRKGETELKEREQHYRILAENITDVIWIMDRRFRFTYISPSVERLRGYSTEETLKQTPEELFTAASNHRIFTLFSRIFANAAKDNGTQDKDDDVHTLELWFTTQSGKPIPTEARISVLRDANGKADRILGVSRDITERYDAKKILEESEKYYAELVNQLADPVVTIDRQGYVLSLNRAAEKMLDQSGVTVKGRHIRDCGLIAASSVSRLLQEFTMVILGRGSKQFAIEMTRHDGTVFSTSASARLLRHDKNNLRVELLFRPAA